MLSSHYRWIMIWKKLADGFFLGHSISITATCIFISAGILHDLFLPQRESATFVSIPDQTLQTLLPFPWNLWVFRHPHSILHGSPAAFGDAIVSPNCKSGQSVVNLSGDGQQSKKLIAAIWITSSQKSGIHWAPIFQGLAATTCCTVTSKHWHLLATYCFLLFYIKLICDVIRSVLLMQPA